MKDEEGRILFEKKEVFDIRKKYFESSFNAREEGSAVITPRLGMIVRVCKKADQNSINVGWRRESLEEDNSK